MPPGYQALMDTLMTQINSELILVGAAFGSKLEPQTIITWLGGVFSAAFWCACLVRYVCITCFNPFTKENL